MHHGQAILTAAARPARSLTFTSTRRSGTTTSVTDRAICVPCRASLSHRLVWFVTAMTDRDEGNVTGGRGRLAGGAVPGPPQPSAGGGLPDARLSQRGRRRRAGCLAPAQPRRHQQRPEPRRLADDMVELHPPRTWANHGVGGIPVIAIANGTV